jgi:hypothetical protein
VPKTKMLVPSGVCSTVHAEQGLGARKLSVLGKTESSRSTDYITLINNKASLQTII